MRARLQLSLSLILFLFGAAPAAGDTGMTEDEIWDSCWKGEHAAIHRNISYRNPIRLVIHNISRDDWMICVYDTQCPRTVFSGFLRHNNSITLSACSDNSGYGSITVMNADGEMWHFDDTGDRIITIKK